VHCPTLVSASLLETNSPLICTPFGPQAPVKRAGRSPARVGRTARRARRPAAQMQVSLQELGKYRGTRVILPRADRLGVFPVWAQGSQRDGAVQPDSNSGRSAGDSPYREHSRRGDAETNAERCGGSRVDKTRATGVAANTSPSAERPPQLSRDTSLMASTIFVYPVQRQRLPEIPLRISVSLG